MTTPRKPKRAAVKPPAPPAAAPPPPPAAPTPAAPSVVARATSTMSATVAQCAKAFVAGAIAAATSLLTAFGDNSLSTQEAITAALAFFVAVSAVYAIPNRPGS